MTCEEFGCQLVDWFNGLYQGISYVDRTGIVAGKKLHCSAKIRHHFFDVYLLFNGFLCIAIPVPPEWLSGERVGLMTWWFLVPDPLEAKFFPSVFSPLTSAETCEKVVGLLERNLC